MIHKVRVCECVLSSVRVFGHHTNAVDAIDADARPVCLWMNLFRNSFRMSYIRH